MIVTVLNPEAVQDIYKNHGEFACECYGTDVSQAEKVGRSCQKSGHMSGSRTEYIKFRISDVDRGTAEQILRHEIGTRIPIEEQDNYSFSELMEMNVDVNPSCIVKNMASFRYIDKDGFDYYIPESILLDDKLVELYGRCMKNINVVRTTIVDKLIEDGYSRQKANEDANFLLPRATTTSLTIGFTVEALIHFMHKRLCSRAQTPIRKMAQLMRDAVADLNPVLAIEFVPHCEHLLWCPEGKGCGRRPSKQELIEKIEG